MAKIEVKIEEKVFHRPQGDLSLLHNVSLLAEKGQIVVVLGESGCGKSTLLRLIVGLDNSFEGKILGVQGKESIGMIFQDIRLLPWKTVRENIRFAASSPSRADEMEIDRLLRLVHLAGAGDLLPKELSGGMAQRVALARALVNEPEVLLFDEPFSSLDSLTRNTLQAELLQIVHEKGITCVFVTHDLDEAVFLADRITLISANHASASISDEIHLSRPRDRLSLEFANERARIGNELSKLTGRKVF